MSGTARTFNVSPQYIGAMCANYRRYHTEASQEDVAIDVGCSRETVSKFERGSICNGIVFLWYIKQGIFNKYPIDTWNGWNI